MEEQFSYEGLYQLLQERNAQRPEGSYTTYLFEKGLDKILKKVGEECTEVIIAAKAEDHKETVYEIADLAYHVMVLNGPTVGVDIGSKHDIHAILQRLANEGMAIIIISDDLPEVLENCSRLLVLKAGRVVKELLPAETSEQEVLSYML